MYAVDRPAPALTLRVLGSQAQGKDTGHIPGVRGERSLQHGAA